MAQTKKLSKKQLEVLARLVDGGELERYQSFGNDPYFVLWNKDHTSVYPRYTTIDVLVQLKYIEIDFTGIKGSPFRCACTLTQLGRDEYDRVTVRVSPVVSVDEKE